MLFAVSLVTGVVSLVCWIIVLIRMFGDSIMNGIAGLICGLYAFIWGWIHNEDENLNKVMLIWTLCWLANLLMSFAQMKAA